MFSIHHQSILIDNSNSGIATHCIPSHRLDSVIESLSNSSYSSDTINRILEQFSAEYEPSSLMNEEIKKHIEQVFIDGNIDCIKERLQSLKDNHWAMECLDMLDKASPIALYVCLFSFSFSFSFLL